MKKHALYSVVICLALVAGLSLCTPLRVGAADKTTVGASAATCTPGVVNSTFTYRDETAQTWPKGGVEFQAQVFDVEKCSQGTNGTSAGMACGICDLQFCHCYGWPQAWASCVQPYLANPSTFCPNMKIPTDLYGVTFQFTSTNRFYPGSGIGFACIRYPQKLNLYPFPYEAMTLIVGMGQYTGYVHDGPVRGNPIQIKPCN